MRYIYFTKSLQSLDLPGVIAFLKEVGLDGADLAVRPGYPVNPANVRSELPAAAKLFRDAGLSIGLVTTDTKLTDPDAAESVAIFEATGKAGLNAVKVGYFRYTGKFDADLAAGRKRLAGYAKLAERTGVRALYHTHSGPYLGNNAAGLRLLLADVDPHHVGAMLDTGHTAINGGPFAEEADVVRTWLTQVAIKDMAWEKTPKGWKHDHVPVGDGIVQWKEVAQGLKAVKFDGVLDLHAEYPTKDLTERKELAKKELAALKKLFGR
jgi:sugar phosphate isomerase/epimerase